MRRLVLGFAAVVVTAGAVLTGCPATHGGYPDNKCKLDKDCYVGEMCDTVRELCMPIAPDFGMDMAFPYDFKKDDMPPAPDDGGGPSDGGDDL